MITVKHKANWRR